MKGKKIGVVLGYLAMLIQNLSAFILTPLLIFSFGDGDFGIYRLVLTISSYFALADLGLSNAVVRYVSEYKTMNDKISESRFVSLIILIDLLVGFMLTLLGILIYFKLPIIFGSSFRVEELNLLKNLFFLTLANGIFNLFSNLASGIIKSYENFALLKIANIARTFIRFGIAIILITLELGVFSIILLDTLLSLLFLIVISMYCLKNLKIRISFNLLNKDYALEIFSYSIVVFVDAIAFHLFWNADNFIIGIFLSSSAIAIYSIGTQISSLFFSISIIVSDVIMPGIVKEVTNGVSDDQLTDSMIKIGRIKLIILAFPVIGFIFLGKDFINFWVGKEYIESYMVALLVIIPSTIAGVFDAGLYIMWAKNKHKIKSIVSLLISFLNILLTIFLVQSIGIIGAAIGTSFAYIVGYNIFNTVYFHKYLGLNMIRFSTETLRGIWVPIIVATIFSYSLTFYLTTTFLIFVLKVFGITLVYIGFMIKFGFNEKEKSIFSNIIEGWF